MNTQLAAQVLEHLSVGDPVSARNLVFFPLFLKPGLSSPPFLSMGEALERQTLRVTEVHESGSVGQLIAANTGDLPILLVDGEEVKGAKQNRMINTSILLEPHTQTVIPVSCTEQHRWGYQTRHFAASEHMVASKIRMMKNIRMKESLLQKRGYAAGQGEIWNEIQELHGKLGSSSRTSAMLDAYQSRQDQLEQARAEVPLQPGQTGMLIFQDGEFSALEFLAEPKAYQTLHERLVTSFLIESIADGKEQVAPVLKERAIEIGYHLENLKEDLRQSGVGAGEDLRWSDGTYEATGLLYKEALLHYHAFSSKGLKDQAPKRRTASHVRHASASPAAESTPGHAEQPQTQTPPPKRRWFKLF